MTIPVTAGQAAGMLQDGAVIAYPTEAVWGLGCDPRNVSAVQRLLAVKQRDVAKGLILVAARLDQLKPFLDFAALAPDRLADVLASWPGPHTWIMPADRDAPAWITGSHDGIAVRVSAHAGIVALCEAFGGALVSTSANPAGADPAREMAQLDARLLAAIDGIVDGETDGLARPTVIRDARTGSVLRP